MSNEFFERQGLYPTRTTCASPTGATYTASYDAWGNLTNRTSNATTATLTYDVLDHLVTWNAGSTNQQWYAYYASGSSTTYVFGLKEHLYGAAGITTSNTYTSAWEADSLEP